MANPKRVQRFHQKFSESRQLQKGGRKADSNYFRRHFRSKKIAYISHLIENTDQLLIVSSVTFPEFKPGLIDRFLILAQLEGVPSEIVLTKTDLLKNKKEVAEMGSIYEGIGLRVHYVSSKTGQGVEAVRDILKDRKTAVVGHSGVGKTTLLNRIDPDYSQKVQEVSDMTHRGRHTTTQIRRHSFSFGGEVYDMPGLKEIDFMSLTKRDLGAHYEEFAGPSAECRFSNCSHTHEESCGVKKALEEGRIHPVRFENYLQIYDSLPDL